MRPRRKPTNDRLRAVGYARVSTEEQGQHGVSLAAQKERIAAYCTSRDWNLLRVYEDVASGKDRKRRGLQRLLDDAKKGEVEAVVFTKLDRLSRRVLDWGHLQEDLRTHEVAVVSIFEGLDDTTPIGRAMANVVATFAQLERETIAERTRVALAYKRQHGQVYGPVPYGFKRKADLLLPNAEQLAVVQEIFRRRKTKETLRQIAEKLMARKVAAPRGGTDWSAETVRIILRNAALYGRVTNDLLPGD